MTKYFIIIPILNATKEHISSFIVRNSFIRKHKNIILFVKTTNQIAYDDLQVIIHTQNDGSIYEAWNQSVTQLRQFNVDDDYLVTFCGYDEILSEEFFDRVNELENNEDDIVFGDVLLSAAGKEIELKANEKSSMLRKSNTKIWDIFHPGLFMHSRLFKNYLFDDKYQLAADFKFFAQVSNEVALKTRYIPINQALINMDGISNDVGARKVYFHELKTIERELNIKVKGFSRSIEYIKLILLSSHFGKFLRLIYWKLK